MDISARVPSGSGGPGWGPSPRLPHLCLPLCLPPFQDGSLEPGAVQERRAHRGAARSPRALGTPSPPQRDRHGLRDSLPSPGSFLGAVFTNGVTSKSSGRSRRLGFNAGQGASSSPGGHRRPGWPGPRSHPAPGRSCQTARHCHQPSASPSQTWMRGARGPLFWSCCRGRGHRVESETPRGGRPPPAPLRLVR